jgi:acetolactate synthase-1/2/3 large subunit
MAATYGELTGHPGACLVTRGPGAASALNGVAHAFLDRAPILIINEAVPANDAGRVSHQRLDQQRLFQPVTKWSVRVGPDTASEAVAMALRVAVEPPAGPVHVDFDLDVVDDVLAPPASPSQGGDLERARELVAGAEAPVLAIGVGARRAAAAVRTELARFGCPILVTYKAKGIISERVPNAAGLLTGATIEAEVLREADLIVGIGLDPVEFIPGPWPYDAPVLSLAEWHSETTYYEPAVEIVGPLEETLPVLQPLASRGHVAENGFEALRQALDIPGDGLLPQDVVATVRSLAPAGTTATVDSGAHMFAAMAFWTVEEPGEALISSGLATMGFALPAAIAAAFVHRGRRVVCFTGDGGLGMALAELETVARYSLPVLVVVLNDAALSLIEIKQRDRQGGRNAVRFTNSDFAEVARGLGLASRRVETITELEDALGEAFSGDTPFLVDAVVDAGNYGAVLRTIRGDAA